MPEVVLSAECQSHLAEAFKVAAEAPPEAVGGRLVALLESLAGPLWTQIVAQIKAAVASGALTPEAIMAFLAASGVVLPSWLSTLLTLVLPLILSELGV